MCVGQVPSVAQAGLAARRGGPASCQVPARTAGAWATSGTPQARPCGHARCDNRPSRARNLATGPRRRRIGPLGLRGSNSCDGRTMKIAVCVKEVPDSGPLRRIDPATKRIDRSGDRSLNTYDLNAIEEALRLNEAGGGGEVVLVSMGPDR